MDQEARAFRIQQVAVERVRSVRTEYLRDGVASEDIAYECDADPATRHFAAVTTDGDVVGVATAHPEDRLAGYGPYRSPGVRIRGLAVRDEWRGRGVAQALLDAVHDFSRSLGAQEIWGNGRRSNFEFFRRHGYQAVSDQYEVVGQGSHVVVARNLGRLTKAEKTRRRQDDAGGPDPEAGAQP